jgi:hypothetical protein
MLQAFTELTDGSSIVYRFIRRQNKERRSWEPVGFPLMDSNGQIALIDRRIQPDRRLNNIVLID